MAPITPARPPSGDHGTDHRPPAAALRSRAIRRRAGPGHEQKQQHVVDGHHGADEGAPVAQRVGDEERDERAQERAGHAEEQPAEPDHRAGHVRGQRRAAPVAGSSTIDDRRGIDS
jgi:hypothetical protein